MDILYSIIFSLTVFSAVGIILLVLLQQGKGADVGASFGGGASGSVFGSGGSANFLSRSTAILATLFFAGCVALTYINLHQPVKKTGGLMEGFEQTTQTAPAQTPVASDVPSAPLAPASPQIPVTPDAAPSRSDAIPN